MHLIHARTGELKYFIGNKIPPYAILSHTWGEDEVTYRDVVDGVHPALRHKEGYAKIEHTCRQALADGLEYAWVDTCCIDKSSSAELSEAINSMFRWYEEAVVCYVHLADVRTSRDDRSNLAEYHQATKTTYDPVQRRAFSEYVAWDDTLHADHVKDFINTRWLTRGWTLQELIAPKIVVFFDVEWRRLGPRDGPLAGILSSCTRIDRNVLSRYSNLSPASARPLSAIPVAKRMSWAAMRQTTRLEDMAYCLLGIFEISMPLLYGEGERAFVRLQEEILRTTEDLSILAWGSTTLIAPTLWHNPRDQALLAPSVRYFSECHDISPCSGLPQSGTCELTKSGLRATVPVISSPKIDPELKGPIKAAVLGRRGGGLVVLILIDTSEEESTVPSYHLIGANSRLRLVGLEHATDVLIQDLFIQRGAAYSYVRYNEAHDLQGVWLRLGYAEFQSGLRLDCPTPIENWDVLHLTTGAHIDMHAHLRSTSSDDRGVILLTYGSCTWKIEILQPLAASGILFSAPRDPALSIVHTSACGNALINGHHHQSAQWSTQDVYPRKSWDKRVARVDVLHGHLDLAPGIRLRVRMSHEFITCRLNGNPVIELILETT